MVLMMFTRGGGHGGIHGEHFGRGVETSYVASDARRQTIPWVEHRNRNSGEMKTFLADNSTAQSVANLPRYRMQCVDCHNRPTHTFELAGRPIGRALGFANYLRHYHT
jgi:hypothetical protein